MNLADIREGIAARLAEVPGVRSVAHPPDSIPTGAATVVTVEPDSTYVDYAQAFAKGLASVRLTATLWIQAADLRAAFGRLDALLSSGSGEGQSLVDALMDRDRTFGGVCHDIVVDQASSIRTESLADGARYLCADLSIRVLVGRL